MSIRIGLIGAGIMGADHARIIAHELPGAVLQIVCDASGDRARQVADQTGAADIATDPLGVIARSDIDALLIASPDETHMPLCLAAIAAAKPVLCEKPLAQSAADCLSVAEAEMARGRRMIQVGFMRRYDPAYAEMKSVFDQRGLGAAVMMRNIHRAVSAPANFTGQMSITNAAPHEFDISRHVLGTEFTSVTAFQNGGGSEDGGPVVIVLRADQGALVTVEVNVNAGYGYDIRAELSGQTGTIELAAPIHSRLNHDRRATTGYPADWRPRFAEAYRRQAQDWLCGIRTARPGPTGASAWDGYAAARIAEAAVRSLREARTIPIEALQRPAFYAPDAGE